MQMSTGPQPPMQPSNRMPNQQGPPTSIATSIGPATSIPNDVMPNQMNPNVPIDNPIKVVPQQAPIPQQTVRPPRQRNAAILQDPRTGEEKDIITLAKQPVEQVTGHSAPTHHAPAPANSTAPLITENHENLANRQPPIVPQVPQAVSEDQPIKEEVGA